MQDSVLKYMRVDDEVTTDKGKLLKIVSKVGVIIDKMKYIPCEDEYGFIEDYPVFRLTPVKDPEKRSLYEDLDESEPFDPSIFRDEYDNEEIDEFDEFDEDEDDFNSRRSSGLKKYKDEDRFARQ